MKRKDPLKNLKNQRRANKSSLMMDSLNETISSKTPSRRIPADFFYITIRLRDTITIPQSYFIVLIAQVFLTY